MHSNSDPDELEVNQIIEIQLKSMNQKAAAKDEPKESDAASMEEAAVTLATMAGLPSKSNTSEESTQPPKERRVPPSYDTPSPPPTDAANPPSWPTTCPYCDDVLPSNPTREMKRTYQTLLERYGKHSNTVLVMCRVGHKPESPPDPA